MVDSILVAMSRASLMALRSSICLRFNKHTDFAAGADSIRFFDTAEAVGNVFKFLHALNKVLGADIASTRA